jgi:hypothetical protein
MKIRRLNLDPVSIMTQKITHGTKEHIILNSLNYEYNNIQLYTYYYCVINYNLL